MLTPPEAFALVGAPADELLEPAQCLNEQGHGPTPRQRPTFYGTPDSERTRFSFDAPPLADPLNPPVDETGLRRPETLVRPGLALA